MGKPVIVEAVRTAQGKRRGWLAGVHPAVLLGAAQVEVLKRSGIDPDLVEQVIGGCVTQAGEQSNNMVRRAWMHAGLPNHTASTVIDAQCSSAQQSTHLMNAMIAADMIKVGVACGVESMSRIPLGGNVPPGLGDPRPDGWAIDAEGAPTNDPRAMIDGGALQPLGGDRDHGGHKGYCLSTMVDLLSGALSGANWGPFAPPFALRQEVPGRSVGRGIGHFFGALRIDGFIDPDEFKAQVDEWVRVFRAARPAPGAPGVRIPGDPEREAEAVRRQSGIPLVRAVIDDLRDISKRTGIPFD